MLNSIEAIKDKAGAKIILSAYIDTNNKIVINVADNGTGMSGDVIDKIFIPFFSTKNEWQRNWVKLVQTDNDCTKEIFKYIL